MPPYIFWYYTVAVLAVASMPMFLYRERRELVALRTYVVILVGLAYLVAMARQDGVDHSNYVRAYQTNPEEIFDRGYQLLMRIFKSAGLPFESLILLSALTTLVALWRAARFFGVSFGLLLLIYFLHLAVVRDFAQFRSGLALATVLIGITQAGSWQRPLYYLVGASLHFTSVPFAVMYEYCALVARHPDLRLRLAAVLVAALAWWIVGNLLPELAFLDPRVALYLRWQTANYGLPVEQYFVLFAHLTILMLALAMHRWWRDDVTVRTLVLLQVIGVTVFVAFQETAVFAYRLSNGILSLYPILLLLLSSRLRLSLYGVAIGRVAAAALLLVLGLVLISRSGNAEVLWSIGF